MHVEDDERKASAGHKQVRTCPRAMCFWRVSSDVGAAYTLCSTCCTCTVHLWHRTRHVLHMDTLSLEHASNVTLDTETIAYTQGCVLRVSVAVLLELTELAEPVEMPCLCCNTQGCK